MHVTAKQEFRIIPAGRFQALDGRPVGGSWNMSAATGAKLVADAQNRVNEYVIDYEHQTLNSATNGMPAPAAGWFKNLVWRDDGLYVTDARWTTSAKDMIDSGQYRYISPTFHFDTKSLEVTQLDSISLTNAPALDGLVDFAMLKAESPLVQARPPVEMTAREREVFTRNFGDPEYFAAQAAEQAAGDAPNLTARDRENFQRAFGMSV